MCHAGAHLHDHGCIVLLGKVVRDLDKFECLSGIRRLKHRYLGCDGMMSGILLILGGMHACVIGHTDDHTAVHTCIRHGIKGVCSYVKSHVLHTAEAAASG